MDTVGLPLLSPSNCAHLKLALISIAMYSAGYGVSMMMYDRVKEKHISS